MKYLLKSLTLSLFNFTSPKSENKNSEKPIHDVINIDLIEEQSAIVDSTRM